MTKLKRFVRRFWIPITLVVVLLIAAAVTIPLIAGDDDAPSGPRPLTVQEAERLSVGRFLNYQDTGAAFTTTVPTPSGSVAMTGLLDFREHVGYATSTVSQAVSSEIVQWGFSVLLTWPTAATTAGPPAELPAGQPAQQELSAANSNREAVLLLMLGLAADRPDNAQLLRQTDAAWLRADEVRGIPVDVISGPSQATDAVPTGAAVTGQAGTGQTMISQAPPKAGSSTRYWIDATGRILRFEADLPTGTVSIDLDKDGYREFQRVPGLES